MSTPPETRRSMKDLLLVPAGRFFFKYRNFLFPVVFAPVALLVPPRMDPAHPAQDWITDAIGLAVVLGGQGLRALVIGLAYIHRGGKNKQVYAATLVKEGLFAHSRNPLYLGNLMIVFGLVVIHHHPLVYAVVLPFFLYAYFAIVAAEEAYLLDRFGAEYAEYCRTVPRFLLRLRGLGATVRSMEFNWKRLWRKEYGTLFTTLAGVLGLLALERITAYGASASRPALIAIAGVFLLGIVGLVAARVLKKSGALGQG